MFAYKSIEYLHQLLKSRHLFVNPYMVKKESYSIVSFIADVSGLTNRSFYMRTLSLSVYILKNL